MIHLNNGIGGQYQLLKRKASGEIVPLTEKFDNLITDNWIGRLNNGFTTSIASNGDLRYALAVACVGTGSTPPTGADISLENEIARTDNSFSNPQHISHTFTPAPDSTSLTGVSHIRYNFAMGAVVGNITEVGIYHGGFGGGKLATRSLIKDEQGNPTALTVLAGEQLILDYILTVTIQTTYEMPFIFRQGTSTEWNGTIRVRASGKWPASVTDRGADPLWRLCASGKLLTLPDNRWYMTSTQEDIKLPTAGTNTNPTGGTMFRKATTNVPDTSGSTTELAVTTDLLSEVPIGIIWGIYGSTYMNTDTMCWGIQFQPYLEKAPTEQLTIQIITTWSRL